MKLMQKMKVSKTDWWKVAKGAFIAVSGALLTYVAQNIGSWDFGTATPFVVATASILINYLLKVINNVPVEDDEEVK